MSTAGLPTERPNAVEHDILLNSVGVFEIAVWISLWLQGVNFCLAVTYLAMYKSDPTWNKFCAVACNIMSFAFNIIICVEAWIKTVDQVGDYVSIQGFAFVHGFGSLLAPSVDLLVQMWYCHRIWQVSAMGIGATRSLIIPGFVFVLCLISWGFGFASGVLLLRYKGNALLFTENFLYGVYIWQCFSGAADVFITLAFTYYLLRVRTQYKSTNNVLVKLIITVVETNTATAILAMANAIALNRVQLGVNALLAGLLTNSYVTSMLFSLHARTSVQEFGNRSITAFSGTHSLSTFGAKKSSPTSSGGKTAGGTARPERSRSDTSISTKKAQIQEAPPPLPTDRHQGGTVKITQLQYAIDDRAEPDWERRPEVLQQVPSRQPFENFDDDKKVPQEQYHYGNDRV